MRIIWGIKYSYPDNADVEAKNEVPENGRRPALGGTVPRTSAPTVGMTPP